MHQETPINLLLFIMLVVELWLKCVPDGHRGSPELPVLVKHTTVRLGRRLQVIFEKNKTVYHNLVSLIVVEMPSIWSSRLSKTSNSGWIFGSESNLAFASTETQNTLFLHSHTVCILKDHVHCRAPRGNYQGNSICLGQEPSLTIQSTTEPKNGVQLAWISSPTCNQSVDSQRSSWIQPRRANSLLHSDLSFEASLPGSSYREGPRNGKIRS